MTHWLLPLQIAPSICAMGLSMHGDTPREHYHVEGLWSLHLHQAYGETLLNGHTVPICPGSSTITPPNVDLEYHFPERSEYLWAHFALPSEGEEGVWVSAIENLGDDFPELYQALEHAICWFSTRPERAVSRLWDILWNLAERTPAPGLLAECQLHPIVQKATQTIELNLSTSLSVAELARQADVSHNYLTRLFRSAFGTTVIGYIHERRMCRAHHLLTQTTLPIKTIAAQVGIEDLHLFNKTARRLLGGAPSKVRYSARFATSGK